MDMLMTDIQKILEDYNLPANTVYLIELIPLIEMIWADGKNQSHEINTLNRFAIEHIANLSKDANGLEVVSIEDANTFIDYFLSHRPDAELLSELKSLALNRMKQQGDTEKMESLIDYCIDIAAVCVDRYPYHPSERVRKEEKALLKLIIREFSLVA